MRQLRTFILLMLLFIVTPTVYLWALNTFFSPHRIRLVPQWKDDEFLTEPQEPAWVDSNFTEGWSINWLSGQIEGDYGFTVQDGVGDLYATFRGYNYSDSSGFSGITIKKTISSTDRESYPYLRIEHKESSSDPALMFSFSISDNKGQWFDGKQAHASEAWSVLECDLRNLHNGTIAQVSIRLTDEYNKYYAGNRQHTYIRLIGLYKKNPTWTLSCNKQIEANITTEANTLKIIGIGNLTSGTIVSAQRFSNLTINTLVTKYLNILVRTSSINVATRITIWTSASQSIVILLKTYNDYNWHIEIIDLNSFGIYVSGLYMVELGWQQVYDSTNPSTAWYRQLSFNHLEQS